VECSRGDRAGVAGESGRLDPARLARVHRRRRGGGGRAYPHRLVDSRRGDRLGSSPGWLFIVAAGLVALGLAIALERATFAFFELLGIYAPFLHYSDTWFGNLGLAFALAVLGFAILAGRACSSELE
jgi:hypothetical protein